MTPATTAVTGPARVGVSPLELARRVREGDVVVVDAPDLDRRAGEALASRRPVAVVNAQSSLTGRLPVTGALVLVEAGVAVVDAAGEAVLRLRDGVPVTVDGSDVVVDGQVIAQGTALAAEFLAGDVRTAAQDLHIHVASFTANALDALDRDAALLLDGVGLPELRLPIDGRPVVVVTPRCTGVSETLKRFARERRPVVIGVAEGADVARSAGLVPRIVLGDIEAVTDDVLRRASQVIVHDPEGRDAGRHRAQASGLTYDACDAALGSEDVAVLAAYVSGASVIVVAGAREGLLDYVEDRTAAGAGALLARLVAGGAVVDARVLSSVYRHRYSAWTAVGAVALGVIALGLAVWGTPEGNDAITAAWDWLGATLGGRG